MTLPPPLSAMLVHEPLTTAEALNLLVSLLQTGLITWGIRLISQSNTERKANADVLQGVAETLRGHTATLEIQTQALRQLLEERRPHQA